MKKFNPQEFSFHEITKYPEISEYFGHTNTLVKATVINSSAGKETFWYTAIIAPTPKSVIGDQRFTIYKGTFTKGQPMSKAEYPREVFLGLISTDEFGKNLLKHLMGTLQEDSVEAEGTYRLSMPCLYLKS